MRCSKRGEEREEVAGEACMVPIGFERLMVSEQMWGFLQHQQKQSSGLLEVHAT